ncbi:MAG TPA: IS66 family transposase [Planctomycetota bacterium]|nr:IS66 family transposase [Planctomycetota bacterium]
MTLEKALDTIETLEERVAVLTAALDAERREKRDLAHYIDYLRRRLHGPKGERLDPNQLRIAFEDLVEVIEAERPQTPPTEALEAPDAESADDRLPKKPRKQGAHGRKALPAELPRLRVEHDLDAAERCCPSCKHAMSRVGETVTEEVDYVPASLVVREHVRPKYACRCCQEGIVTAELPARLIEKGRPGPGLLAHMLVSKYADHLPLHRQEAIFERHGLRTARSTMCDWVGECARGFFPVVQILRQGVLASWLVHADETPVLMQLNSKGGGKQRAYLWAYVGDQNDVVYDFRTSRGRDGPLDFLEGFEGYLLVDDYAGYNAVCEREGVVKLACWAHTRRGFFEALTSATADASLVLAKIQRLYKVEAEGRELALTPERLRALRQEKSVPILASIREDLDRLAKSTLPKSPLGKAVAYALNLWTELTRYVEDGRLAIDNNTVERAMRGVAVGRKNWLFCGSEAGGQHAAVIYSLIETAKRHGIDPFEYLRDLIERLPTHPVERMIELTPRAWKLERARALAAARA